MVTLPIWAVYVVSIGSPVLAFLGVLLAQWIMRRGHVELEARSKREEVMRTIRWAAELAVSDDEGRSTLGVAELNALNDSDLLDDSQRLFIDAALENVIHEVAEALTEIESMGRDTEVVEDVSVVIPTPAAGSDL